MSDFGIRYGVLTETSGDLIRQEIDMAGLIRVRTLDTAEAQIRDALIALGWRPPQTRTIEVTDWMRRNSDRTNPQAHINTDPAYFGSEMASAIQASIRAKAKTDAALATTLERE